LVDALAGITATDKPVIAVVGSQAVAANKRAKKKKVKVPFFRYAETAAIAMAALNRRRAWLGRDVGKIVSYAVTSEIAQSVIDSVITEGRKDLNLPETLMVLDAYGISVPRYSYAKDLEEALSAAHGLGYPISMRLLSKDLINKKEIGSVFAYVKNADDLTSNFLTLVSRAQRHQLKLDGILIQELIKGDDSISFGVFDDTEFGTLVIFGQEELNGSFARNIRMKPWPLTDVDAADIARSFAAKIPASSGNNGDNGSYELIEETLLRLSQLVKDFDSISEIIINRFAVFPDHEASKTVDAQIKLK
jgi:acyl-CoA synthetase (NDP forming)